MYTTVSGLHSWIRWIALIAAVGTTLAALRGKVDGPRSLADRWGMVAMMALDTQLLLGLLLYFVISPNMKAILDNFGARDEGSGAAVLGGRAHHDDDRAPSRSRTSAACSRERRRRRRRSARACLICFGLATVLIIVGMPWPGRPGGRALFRGL